MKTKVLRKVVTIDEEKCNGCGACVPACAEGALEIVNGKARLVSERYCDGLGACLGECPQGAITIEERESAEFSEEAVKVHLAHARAEVSEELPCGCPATTVAQFARQADTRAPSHRAPVAQPKAMLSHWPIQLPLVPPSAPFLRNADLVLAADCVPFAYADFHQQFLKDHAVVVGCPKLDDFQAHLRKMTDILRQSSIRSLTVLHMEVPCCFGLVQLAKQALRLSGKDIPFRAVTIGVKGEMKSEP